MSYRVKEKAKIHPTHKLGKEYSTILAPAGTPRFYGVRECKKCGGSIAEHSAGLFIDDELKKPCV